MLSSFAKLNYDKRLPSYIKYRNTIFNESKKIIGSINFNLNQLGNIVTHKESLPCWSGPLILFGYSWVRITNWFFFLMSGFFMLFLSFEILFSLKKNQLTDGWFWRVLKKYLNSVWSLWYPKEITMSRWNHKIN